MPRPSLSPAFRTVPLAHRALHDRAAGRPENSLSAVRAAVAAGYGIEIDLQLSQDGEAMVFHDATLSRVARARGSVGARTAAALGRIALRRSTHGDTIPTLSEVLQEVAGKVPLLIEVKDQADGGSGVGVGPLEAATARALADWDNAADWVAVMSFNPGSVAAMATAAPAIPRGLTTWAWPRVRTPRLRARLRDQLRSIEAFDDLSASFVSHDVADLDRPRLADLRAQGAAILCWTVRSARVEARARRYAHNITFEGYLPVTSGPAFAAT